MNEQDILNIVEDAFDNQITADDGTPMGDIVGKENFLKEVSNRLKLLFDKNDLRK